MNRRKFLGMVGAAPLVTGKAHAKAKDDLPECRIVSPYRAAAVPGMPGPYPGRVVSVRSERCVNTETNAADAAVVKEMLAAGICALTGEKSAGDAWRRFIEPQDVVGIKVNCGGYPHVISAYEIVAEVVAQLMALGVAADRIVVYERFQNQMDECDYKSRLPEGVRFVAAESSNRGLQSRGYDPKTYVEADLFGEDDTRSNMMRLVSRELTKIINIPNVKDHGATGVTGCLKNLAYGSFSNVARTHRNGVSHTLTFVGTLASVEPLRSRTVLQIMDGLRGVWHGGPFARSRRFVFYPKRILFGTDPVAIDRLLLDIVEDERKRQGALSVWDRSPASLTGDQRERDRDPNKNILIREPRHIEYAAKLGLGVADLKKIKVEDIAL